MGYFKQFTAHQFALGAVVAFVVFLVLCWVTKGAFLGVAFFGLLGLVVYVVAQLFYRDFIADDDE
jgi:hypothetical protein